MNLFPVAVLSACLLCACDSDSTSELAEGLAEDTSDEIQEAFADNQQQFLIRNAAREGVTVTESGLQYEQLREGSGTPPGPNDVVTVHYVGTLTNGIEFDSSYARDEPATFPVSGVILGWQEALQLMPVGSEYQLVIPPELAYGDQGAGTQIGPGAVLIFNVELLEINSQ